MFHDTLKNLRESKGYNKRQIAELLGMPYTTYNNYETGTREPNSNVLIKLSKFFNVTIDYLLGSEQKKSPTSEDVGEKDIMESAEKIYKALLFAGFVKEGQELTLAQIDFLDGLSAIISAFFGKHD